MVSDPIFASPWMESPFFLISPSPILRRPLPLAQTAPLVRLGLLGKGNMRRATSMLSWA
jgi:hypothetical protein